MSVAKYGDVAITNTTADTIRFSINGFAWSQTPTDRHKLSDTDKLVYFPQVFTLAGGATQRVRVGMSDPSDQIEHAYRVYIAELPPFNPLHVRGQALTFLSRADIPVFQPPAGTASPIPAIERAAVEDGNLDVLLANDGNAHTMPSRVSVTGRDAGGNVVWSADADVWYVLAKSAQLAKLPLGPALCARIRAYDIAWHVGDRPVTRTIAGGACH